MKQNDIKILDPNTPGTNIVIEVCPMCDLKYKYQKHLDKSRALAGRIATQF